MLTSRCPSGIDWIASARLCLGHSGAGLGLVTWVWWDKSESLWGPKMILILGVAFIAHLQLGRDGGRKAVLLRCHLPAALIPHKMGGKGERTHWGQRCDP